MATEQWYAENQERIKALKRKWYLKNRQEEIANSYIRKKKTIERNLAWMKEYKSKFSCKICGESHIAALDFHHKDPTQKTIAVSRAVYKNWSIKRLEQEVAKCEILCANCHRKYHYEEKQKED